MANEINLVLILQINVLIVIKTLLHWKKGSVVLKCLEKLSGVIRTDSMKKRSPIYLDYAGMYKYTSLDYA